MSQTPRILSSSTPPLAMSLRRHRTFRECTGLVGRLCIQGSNNVTTLPTASAKALATTMTLTTAITATCTRISEAQPPTYIITFIITVLDGGGDDDYQPSHSHHL
ncbi:hypothetical protein SprV_0902767800 [Sparganum proliferum]